MKSLLLILVLIPICVVLFITGVVAPRRSKKMQRGVDRLAKKGEVRGDRNGGRLGDVTQSTLEAMRRAADASARGGRRVNDKVTPD